MDANIIANESDESNHQKIIAELSRNRELLERIFASSEKARRYIFWLHVMSILKIVLIVVPLIIGLIFVGPLLKNLGNVMSIYTGGNIDDILDEDASGDGGVNNFQDNIKELKNILNEK